MIAGFPTNPADVTPQWLGEKLSAVGVASPDSIERIEWQAIGTGQVGDSVRFSIAYRADATGPSSVAGKFPAADVVSRGTAAALGLYAKEVLFYREIATELPVRTPAVFAAEFADDGVDFVLIFEDVGPARGGNQLDGCTIEDARLAIVQAAAFHAPSWQNDAILKCDWLQSKPAQTAQIRALYPQAQAVFRERYADMLEPEYMALCDRLAVLEDQLFARPDDPVSLVHGDFRLDNMLFDIKGGAEAIAILDWQTLTIGNGLTDIGYFLGCGIGDLLRRGHENELLDLYCAEMRGRGVPLTRSDIWDDYRHGALHGISTAVFSAAFVERTERGDANFLSMARGACALATEHGSLDLLEKE